jgi:hypothetical protein
MLRTSFPVFDADLVDFIESGCATIVGFVTVEGAPFATRAWGTSVVDVDPPRVRLLLGAGALATAGRSGSEPFDIAFTGGDVRTLRSVQVKGTARDLEPAAAADLDRARAYCDAFFDAVCEADGTPRPLMERLAPVDLVACTVDVDEVYDQTPGPGAGARLR